MISNQPAWHLDHSTRLKPFALHPTPSLDPEVAEDVDATSPITRSIDELSDRLVSKLQKRCQDLEEALLQEQQAHELKRQYLADISHDLRTPLSIIASSAGLLESMGDCMDAAKRQKHFQRIQTKVTQMAQLLDDLLLLSHAEHQQFSLQLSEIDLAAFGQAMIEDIQPHTANHRLLFSASEAGASLLPKAFAIHADAALLYRVFSNLLYNSIKYSPDGGDVWLTLEQHDRGVVMEVVDEGIGIPTGDRQRLFDSFYRASNTGVIPGIGLGLAIARRCVELHHGQIWVRDNPIGRGIIFGVELPRSV